MALFRVYVALSLDGYIADREGGVAWLEPFFSPEIDFEAFQTTIGVTVSGRKTFDQARARGPWRHEGRMIVMTHYPIDDPPPGVESFAGDVHELAEGLRRNLEGTDKDVWLMGGGESIAAFHDAGLVDRWELFWIPVLLGAGVPLFPSNGPATSRLRPIHARTYSNGIVEAWYEPVRREQDK